MMAPLTLTMRFRSWLAGRLFALAGKLDDAYDVWLDDAPRRDDDPGGDMSTDKQLAVAERTLANIVRSYDPAANPFVVMKAMRDMALSALGPRDAAAAVRAGENAIEVLRRGRKIALQYLDTGRGDLDGWTDEAEEAVALYEQAGRGL